MNVSGRPRTSKATSTPIPPVNSRMVFTASTFDELTTSVAPSFLAASSLSSRTSTARICDAPNALAICTIVTPTPPDAACAHDGNPFAAPQIGVAHGAVAGEPRAPERRRLLERQAVGQGNHVGS